MKKAIMIVTLTCLSLSAAPAKDEARDAVEWTRGMIVAHGLGKAAMGATGLPMDGESGAVVSLNRARIDAGKRAREDALARMTRLVGTLRVDADTMLADLLENDETVQRRLVNIIAARTRFREYPSGFAGSACRAELMIGALLPAVPFSYPMDDFPERIDNPIPTPYTGLVIDARGLGVEPMMLPSVYNEDGLEIYGRPFIDARLAGRHGIVAYARDEDDAMGRRTAGERPYFCAALRGMKGCPVLADRDVRKIFSSQETVARLRQCRVIFIIDKPKR